MTADSPLGTDAGAERALAYVFWHQPARTEPTHEYEAALAAFHRTLAGSPIDGLLATRTVVVPDLPWLPEGGYEDWYVLRDYGDLGHLNEAAVDVTRRRVHDDIASRSERGAGAVYGLSLGTAASTPDRGVWVSKPRGTPYKDFYDTLLAHIGSAGHSLPPGVGVWRRQLVLGPAPEFCVTSPRPLPALPPEWAPLIVPVRSIHAATIDPVGTQTRERHSR